MKVKKVHISRDFHFEAAHKLPNYNGPCGNLHGHRYEGNVIVSRPINPKTGFVMDYSDLKKIIEEEILVPYDHRDLNEYFSNPTAEVLVSMMFEIIYHRLRQDFPDVDLERVELKETENSLAYIDRCDVLEN